jgi:hypothetical protein
MDGCKVGYHHAKRLGLVNATENLPAHSLQFIGNFIGQWKDERGVDALKRNVQPRAVIERQNLRLRSLGSEIYNDVFGQGILVADFEHSEKVIEMALGEFRIDGETNLSPLLCGSNDSALRSGCPFLAESSSIPFVM